MYSKCTFIKDTDFLNILRYGMSFSCFALHCWESSQQEDKEGQEDILVILNALLTIYHGPCYLVRSLVYLVSLVILLW